MQVRTWNNDLEPERAYDISAAALQTVVVKSLDHRTGNVVVGTASSEIYELDQESGEVELLIRGHSHGEVTAVSSHPTKPLYGSVGDDATLRLWDLAKRKPWKTKGLEAQGRSIHFSPDGKLVACGHNNGSWSVHRLDSMDEVIATRDRKKDIHTIKFSPNGRYLAVGSEDCMIDLYDCVSDFDWMGTLQGHSFPVSTKTPHFGTICRYFDPSTLAEVDTCARTASCQYKITSINGDC
jgi:microtubule-associated protein-like 5